MNLIMASFAGSHLYGTNRPESDIDIRGICHQPIESLLGIQGFEQYHPSGVAAEKFSVSTFNVKSDDVTIYGVNKFFQLCLNANPNILELLFVPPDKTLFNNHTGKKILYNRNLFLSTKVIHTFAGYAYSQLQRIQRHKKWINSSPENPNPFEYGLYTADNGNGVWADDMEYQKYKFKHKEWQHYQEWQKNRNPARARLEELHSFDTKHAAHLYRLILEAEELLLTGEIQLPLKNRLRQTYFDVLDGKYSYEEVVQFGQEGKDRLLALENSSVLPKRPNHKEAEKLLIEINTEHLYYTRKGENYERFRIKRL